MQKLKLNKTTLFQLTYGSFMKQFKGGALTNGHVCSQKDCPTETETYTEYESMCGTQASCKC